MKWRLFSDQQKAKEFIYRSLCYVKGSSREDSRKMVSDKNNKSMQRNKEQHMCAYIYIEIDTYKKFFSFLIFWSQTV